MSEDNLDQRPPLPKLLPRASLLSFVMRMEAELRANAHKGDWNKWEPRHADSVAELEHHIDKMEEAIKQSKHREVAEYAADLGNIASKIYEEAKRHDPSIP